MLDKEKKILFIVADKNCMKYARILETLISERKNIQCTVFDSIQVFEDNKLSSDNLVVFIGKNKVSSSIVEIVNKNFDQFGVRYGWRGTRAAIWIESLRADTIFNGERVNEFAKYYNKNLNEFNKLDEKLYEVRKFIIANTFPALIFPDGELVFGSFQKIKEIEEAQYKLGVIEFMKNGIDKFIGVGINE